MSRQREGTRRGRCSSCQVERNCCLRHGGPRPYGLGPSWLLGRRVCAGRKTVHHLLQPTVLGRQGH
eukprot:13618109-Alexandrium_andersonii.AAC.1